MAGFGNTPPFGGFGNPGGSNPFGGQNNTNNAHPPFQQPFGASQANGPPQGSPFGGQPQVSSGFGQPFGGGGAAMQPQQQPALTFGKSPNVAMPPPAVGFPPNAGGMNSSFTGAPASFGPTASGNPFGGTPFAQASQVATPPAPFGPTTGPFGGGNPSAQPPPVTFGVSKTVAQSHPPVAAAFPPFGNNPNSSGPFAGSNPFGSNQEQNNMSFGGGQDNDMDMAQPRNPFGTKKKPRAKPKTTPFGPPAAAQQEATTTGSDDGMTDGDTDPEKALAEMKAKIAAKKERARKLEERKKKEEDESQQQHQLSADAAPFTPRVATQPPRSRSPKPPSRLPADLRNKPAAAATTAPPPTARENLDDAVALVGLCAHMCPDEEISRREAESDVQLLERPDPSLHPPHWTLRDTMIKRFRRSAADFKLDVPEWVRPPDVLERVCGYLEEWIMVRTIVCL